MNKKIFIIPLILFIAIAYSSVDVTQPWHPMQQILRTGDYTIDDDNNEIIDTVDASITTYVLYPDITGDKVCTNNATTCDERYYLKGEDVSNTLKLDGRKVTDLCYADGSNCIDAYMKCDNEIRICNTLYADNSIIFESAKPLINCHSIMETNNLTLHKNINSSILVVNNDLVVDNITIEPLANGPELIKYFAGTTDVIYTDYSDLYFGHSSGLYHDGHYVLYDFKTSGYGGYIPPCIGYGATGKFVQTNDTSITDVQTCIINASLTSKRLEFHIYGKEGELRECPSGWQRIDIVISSYQVKPSEGGYEYKPIYMRRCIKYV